MTPLSMASLGRRILADWVKAQGTHIDGSRCPECNGERVIRNEWTGEADRCPTCTQIDAGTMEP